MKELYAWRDRIEEIYSEKTIIFEIVGRFIIGLMVLTYINSHLGYMEMLDKSIVVIGLSAAGAALPLVILLVFAVGLILAHTFSLSMVLAGCVAVVFLMMFIVHFRFTSELVVVTLITTIALAMNIPYVLPIACGLLVGPMAAIPMSCGVVGYYLLEIIADMSSMSGIGELSMDGIMADAFGFSSAILECKEMIFYVVVLSVGLWVVTGVRRIHMNYAWKIAMASGVVVMFITAFIIGAQLESEVSGGALFMGSILALLVGIVIEFLFLSVDYKKTEYLEFQDDEYYYCIKAIPITKGLEKKINRKKNVRDRKNKRRNEELIEVSEEQVEIKDDMSDFNEFEIELQDMDGVEEHAIEGSTTVLETEEIERELRSNAYNKAVKSDAKQKKHAKTNYKMLKESVLKELKRK